jgi:hypothetical protein
MDMADLMRMADLMATLPPLSASGFSGLGDFQDGLVGGV